MALRFSRILLVSAALLTSICSALAQGPAASIRGSEERNFGRLVLTLPSAQKVTARVSSGVLVISFSEPVSISAERIQRELPRYVSVARIDPDGLGVRMALTDQFASNVLEAGEKVFVDLIPANWQGMLPGLPADVVEDMAKRLRAAETIARNLAKAREQAEVRDVEVRAATLPTLSRLVFDLPSSVNVEHKLDAGKLSITMNGALRLEPSRLRSILPEGVKLDGIDTSGGLLRLTLTIPKPLVAQAFREDDGFIVDLTDPTKAPRTTESAEAEPVKPDPAKPDPAKPAPARPEPAKSAPVKAEPGKPVLSAAAPKPPAAPTERAAPAVEAAPQAIRMAASATKDGARVDFQFPRRTAAAAFEDRGEIVVVFDTVDTLDPAQLMSVAGAYLSAASATKEGKATVLRLQTRQPGLVRLGSEDMRWSLTIGDEGTQPVQPLRVRRISDERGQTVLSVPLQNVSGIHWIGSESGQNYAVATAYGPGAAIPKPQRFVEFQLNQTMQGVAVLSFADDVAVRAGVGEVIIGRGASLAVSEVSGPAGPNMSAKNDVQLTPDRAIWAELAGSRTRERMEELFRRAAEAPRSERTVARMRLAQFQLANGLDAESLGPVGAVLREDPNMRQDRQAHILRAIAQTMLRRNRDAETILAQPFLKDDPEAALWRAVIDSRRGRLPQALAGLKRGAEITEAYPDALQGLVRRELVRAALALRDLSVAERELVLLGSLAPRHIGRDEVEFFRAQLDEASGRPEAAMAGYKALFGSDDRGVAARAQLRAVQLADRENDGSITAEEALARLETVAFTWRGDEVEIEALGELGAIYLKQQRWRDAFGLARKANGFFPEHAITRNLHDEAARQFDELFTTAKADKLPRVDALALFYDFKEFLPIGRRGDEIIRRLADRLVELDLLDQAGELLQHQIDNRLTGAARATVATRLAMIRLMSEKPSEALSALTTTRLPELPREVKRARQLLEAKALSDLSRTDLALELLASERGPEVDRLRADILWTARRWRDAGEAHERILGDAWRGPGPLDERQRADAMRAGVAYVMADEPLSLDRLRAKYAGPMAQTPDARTFAFVTGANRAAPGDLRELARRVANADTLTEFMSEYRKRYPDFASALRARQQREAEGAPAEDASAKPPRQAETPPANGGRPG